MGDFGVYIHVPFCASRCDFCSFAIWTDKASLMRSYVDCCRREMAAAVEAGAPPATSVYVGGGTPSLLPSDLVCELLSGVARLPGTEVTLEANPEDVDEESVSAWCAAGVSRVSLGVQSLQDHVLASLGRQGEPERARSAARLLSSSGLASWNVDLIYGAAGESEADWCKTLSEVCSWRPPHISAYALSADPGTPLWRDRTRHPDDDVQARRYEVAEAMFGDAGLSWYEVSNWSLPGHESRHNQNYWSQGEYLGIGCAAHSHRRRRRSWNVRSPERYIDLVSQGRSAERSFELLSEGEARLEGRFLALRTRGGVPASAFGGARLEDGSWRIPEVLHGLVRLEGSSAVLTLSGRLLANEVSTYLSADA